jgi:hypothetical protein
MRIGFITASAVLAVVFGMPQRAFAQVDLQGYWTNATPTPLERPAKFGGREFYTDAEMAENAKLAAEPTDIAKLAGTDIHYNFQQYGLDPSQSAQNLSRRTSIVIDPPDGRIPAMNDKGRARAQARAAERRLHGQFDGPEQRPLSERCIIWPGTGPPMLPEAYNNNIQILQGDGYAAILLEMNHDVRIVPIDGSPHPGPNIRQYMGDSRGHWEGKTLVVDTTNFNGKTNFHGAGEDLHVIERFTRVDDKSILYEFTVEGAETWARPWRGELMLTKTEGPIFEFACHEGNRGMPNTLAGARAAEAAAGEKEKAPKEPTR